MLDGLLDPTATLIELLATECHGTGGLAYSQTKHTAINDLSPKRPAGPHAPKFSYGGIDLPSKVDGHHPDQYRVGV